METKEKYFAIVGFWQKELQSEMAKLAVIQNKMYN